MSKGLKTAKMHGVVAVLRTPSDLRHLNLRPLGRLHTRHNDDTRRTTGYTDKHTCYHLRLESHCCHPQPHALSAAYQALHLASGNPLPVQYIVAGRGKLQQGR